MVRPSEHAMNQNVELQKKNIELAHLYSDLEKSFEALCEINKKLREANERLEKTIRHKLSLLISLLMSYELQLNLLLAIAKC